MTGISEEAVHQDASVSQEVEDKQVDLQADPVQTASGEAQAKQEAQQSKD
jgi:hypothetical protein